MKIIRVFPQRTEMTPRDDLAVVGEPSMFRPEADEVHISTVFTWDISEAERLRLAWQQYYPIVKVGGCAFDDPCNSFTPGLYVRCGVAFTSRGCNNQCPWCLVWRREGKLKEIEISPGNIIQDNNLLQCSTGHLEKVFSMLRGQCSIEFKGGLDSRLMTDDIANTIRSLRVKQVFLACDTEEAIRPLRKAIKRLALPQQKVRCYVLVKFDPDETISEATERMFLVWEAGAMPFAQLYQPSDRWIDYSTEWRQLARAWSRPAAMKAIVSRKGV